MKKSVQIGSVLAVCKNSDPGIPKFVCDQIDLIMDFGVQGDYHAGTHIRHRYLAGKDPFRANNRQVLIIDTRIITDIKAKGISPLPGQLGENILLSDISLMRKAIGTKLQIGDTFIQLTEIRHPCSQLNAIHPNLMETVMPIEADPSTYNAGILGVVVRGGTVSAGDKVYLKA